MPVDYFMRALAEQKGNRAVGVILSGSGTDGTLGMAEIQAQGGVTFAQDDASAKYDGMPRSAAVAGYVDYVLSPKGIRWSSGWQGTSVVEFFHDLATFQVAGPFSWAVSD